MSGRMFDDFLLDDVFEPVARWIARNLSWSPFWIALVAYAISLCFLAAAAVMLVQEWGTRASVYGFHEPIGFLTVQLLSGGLVCVTAWHTVCLEQHYRKYICGTLLFRTDRYLRHCRFFGPIAAVMFLAQLGLGLAQGNGPTWCFQLFPLPLTLGAYFASCTRYPPEYFFKEAHAT